MSVTGEALGETGRKPPSVSALPTWASLAPVGLANILIEADKATDYDHLLLTNGEAHE
jgi:hypothetical protein